MSTMDVRESFRRQAASCAKLGSPFTARLCEVLAASLDDATAFGRRTLAWPPEKTVSDAIALRCCGAFHALARSGRCPVLSDVYPPHPLPAPDSLWDAVAAALAAHDAGLTAFLDGPPQTNEVMRSGVLLGGFLIAAKETGLPLAIFEIGASAGLNLLFDHYRYELGDGRVWGDPASPVLIPARWTGRAPALDTKLAIASRSGCDVNPICADNATDRARLLNYIWPDQPARLARIDGALALTVASGLSVDADDAAHWVERRLPAQGPVGICRVLFHSIMWQYMPVATQEAILAHMTSCGAAATAAAPFAWLRLEADGGQDSGLRLTLWPGGDERVLARAGYHGASADWL